MGCECESFKWVIVNRFLLIHDDWTFTSMDTKICSPTNKFWGKVLFLHLSVILFTGEWGLCMMSLPVWLAGDSVQGGVSVQRDLCLEGVSVQGGLCQGDSPCSKERAVRILLEFLYT